jgi:hypothetical protein
MPTDEDYPLEYSLMANGYNFDFINEDTLLRHSTVESRELHTPGNVYPSLVLRNESKITLELAEKLAEFARAGLPIVFAEVVPSEEVSFKDYGSNGRRIQQIMQDVIGSQKDAAAKAADVRGKGSVRFVLQATGVPEVLQAELKVSPNLRFAHPEPSIFFHQFDIGTKSFFFFRNSNSEPQKARVTLAAGRRIPEIWNAWTGEVSEAPEYRSENGTVTLDLRLKPYDSELIALEEAPEREHVEHVVRTNFPSVERISDGLVGLATEPGTYHTVFQGGKGTTSVVSPGELPPALTLGPNWELKLMGKDKDGTEWSEQIHASPLRDWTLSQNLRYFSGHGHYSLDFVLGEHYVRPGLALELDLGEVHDVAEVWINQKKVNALLMRPYRVDIAPYVKAGSNHVEIIVTNTLRNRLVGDGSSGDPHFVMFQRRMFFMPSGMVGPVRLTPEARVKLP